MSKIKLLENLIAAQKKDDAFYRSLPNQVSDAFFDNDSMNAKDEQIMLLLNTVFTEREMEFVEWFLYEWVDGHMEIKDEGGERFVFGDRNDAMVYLADYEGWK